MLELGYFEIWILYGIRNNKVKLTDFMIFQVLGILGARLRIKYPKNKQYLMYKNFSHIKIDNLKDNWGVIPWKGGSNTP